MAFLEPHRDLGTVKVGSKHELIYRFTPDITVYSVTTSCGCSFAEASNDLHFIKVTYVAEAIPWHLLRDNILSKDTAKSITIFFEAPTSPGLRQEETLTFKAHVTL